MLTQKTTQHRTGLQVIPAVDLLGDAAVRLERGDFSRVVAREADPVALVARLVRAGARLVHVVDLDGARSGRTRPDVVRRLAEAAAPALIQASGGVRSISDAEKLLEAGAARVVVGTAAFSDQRALEEYRAALDGRLVVAIDVREGRVVASGWTEATGLSAADAARRCAAAGVPRLLCTAVDRDGTLEGPDLDLIDVVRAHSGLPVVAAGGVGSLEDLAGIARLGCEGAIVGRALLDGRLALSILQRP
jgi:phosphoribosylformimino-5-aminoimidazole carboxamide ribotide isomerase